MAAKSGLFAYLRAAFNARPFGMFVAPNWIGLAAFGVAGLVNPGFWAIGAGVELAYLLMVGTHPRFQRLVDARADSGKHSDWDRRVATSLARLTDRDRRRYQALSDQFRAIIEMQMHGASGMSAGLDTQSESLARLLWMYLQLLVARHTIEQVLGLTPAVSGTTPAARPASAPTNDAQLRGKLADLERRAAAEAVDAELRRSLEGQIDILKQRLDHRSEGQQKLAYIDAELARIEQQGELIREQAALVTDPAVLSRRIDEIAATLGGTSQWIRDQQQVFGAMEDLLGDGPRPVADTRTRETQ